MHRPVNGLPDRNTGYKSELLERVVDGVGTPHPRDQSYFCGAVWATESVRHERYKTFYRVTLERPIMFYRVTLQAHRSTGCKYRKQGDSIIV
jgi:hypothetical protein